MKSIVTILALVLCAAAVSAAPSTSNPTFTELASKPMNKVKCVLDVVSDLVRDIDLKDELEEFKTAVKEFGKNQALCVIIADRDFVVLLKCQAYVTKTFFTAVYKFIQEVSKVNMHLATEIRKEVGKCFTKDEFQTEVSELSEFSKDPIGKFMKRIRCTMFVTQVTVKDTTLADVYLEHKRRVMISFAELDYCVRAPEICSNQIPEAMATVQINVDNLFEHMEKTDSKETQNLKRIIEQTC